MIPNGIATMVTHNIIPTSSIASPNITVISLPVNLKTNPTNHQINKMGQNIRNPNNFNIMNPFLIFIINT